MTSNPPIAPGTREHAAAVTEGRHPGVRDALQWLTFAHLPEQLRDYSAPFYAAAVELVRTITTDSPELITSLDKLIEAKDSGVRAGIRHDTGRAGSVPRPQEVVAPPLLASGVEPGSGAQPQEMQGEIPECGPWRGLHGCPQYPGETVNHRPGSPVYRPLLSGQDAEEPGMVLDAEEPEETGSDEISDGYHTFGELYDHRRALTAALCRAVPMDSWISRAHHPDGDPMFEGYFIVGIDLPGVGTITYHYKLKYLRDFQHVIELPHAPKWDGAPPSATVERLLAWATR